MLFSKPITITGPQFFIREITIAKSEANVTVLNKAHGTVHGKSETSLNSTSYKIQAAKDSLIYLRTFN